MVLVAITALGCAPSGTPAIPVASKARATDQLANVAAGARRCWFGRRGEFASLVLVDERDSRNERLLVVERDDPQGRPRMVVELSESERLQIYGPLATARNVNDAARFARSGARRCA